jgi:hypothetical protein
MPKARRPPHRPPSIEIREDEPLVDPGRGLGLRLLALLGAFSFLLLGISSIAPLLQPAPPPELPGQRQAPVG